MGKKSDRYFEGILINLLCSSIVQFVVLVLSYQGVLSFFPLKSEIVHCVALIVSTILVLISRILFSKDSYFWRKDDIWIGRISYNSNKVRQSYNIYRLKLYENNDNSRISFENYTKLADLKTSILSIDGSGEYNDPFLFFIYKVDNNFKKQRNIFVGNNGVIIGSIQDCGVRIKSKFCQFIKDDNKNEILIAEDHLLYRTDLPRINKLRCFFRLATFSNIDQLENFYNKTERIYDENYSLIKSTTPNTDTQ